MCGYGNKQGSNPATPGYAIGKLCVTANSLGYEVYGFELEGGSITLEFGKPIKFKVDGVSCSD